MFLFKLLQIFLCPSIILELAALIGLFLFLKNKFLKTAKSLLIGSFALYYLFSITPVADLVISPLENQYPLVENADQAEKIVILTGEMELRSVEALRLYFSKIKKLDLQPEFQIIITGTSALNPENNIESIKTKQFLVERGIFENFILIESKSRTTFESAWHVEKLIGQAPFYLVTSGYHMPRAMFAFNAMNMNPIPSPSDFKVKKLSYNLFDFIPGADNLKKVNLAFHEYFGILYYKIIRE